MKMYTLVLLFFFTETFFAVTATHMMYVIMVINSS